MNHTAMVALATLTLGATNLLMSSTAEAAPTAADDEELTAVMGPAQDYQRGLTVNGVAPTLRSVVLDGESILAYCIEYWIQAADPDHESAVTTWDEFTGDNNFKTDPQVRQHVAWILRHSYPTVSLKEMAQHTGTVDLTAPEIITATQAAIWHFTDHFVPDGNLTIEDGPTVSKNKHSADNVQAIFDYLTGSDNTGLSELAVQASVTLEDATDPETVIPAPVEVGRESEHDHVLGPILLNTSAQDAELTVQPVNPDIAPDHLNFVDGNGEPVDLSEPVTADEIWVHVPAELPAGTLHLTAESIEYGYTGRLIIPEPDGQRRFQTIVVVDQATDRAATELQLAWEQPELPQPEPSKEAPATTIEEVLPEVEEVEQTPAEPSLVEQSPDEVSSEKPPIDELATPAPELSEPTEALGNPSEEMSPEPTPPESEPQLAKTGAHELRNVLIGLGALAMGAGLVTINRLKRGRI